MPSGAHIQLFWGDGSPPCWSVLSTLEEKQVTGYQQKKLSFDKKEYRLPEVLAINPRGELPSCQIGDLVINESLALCLYFEETYQDVGTPLLPKDPTERGIVWQRLSEFYWNFPRRGYTNLVKYQWLTPLEKQDKLHIEKAKGEFLKELEIWEGILNQKENGNFLVGNSLTLVDIIAFPWLAFLVHLQLKLAPRFEKLAAYYDFMKEHPSIKKHWPKYWDGSVKTDMLHDLY